MEELNHDEVNQYILDNIDSFHKKRIEKVEKLKLKTVLLKKNPYLFKAKDITTAEQIVRILSDAFLSSNEETIFGDWLEGLAIFVNKKVYGGWKSGISGIDLEFDKNNIRHIVTIKSGPNWGNSSQVKKMKLDFATAAKTLRTSNSNIQVKAINGCCYGRETNPDKGEYFKVCGQEFWSLISNDENLYLKFIEPIGNKAKERNLEFQKKYNQMINRFTKEFLNDFCLENGDIDWVKLLKFNSGKEKLKSS
jgi:hypothetical protein